MNTYSDLNRYYPENEIDLVDLWLYVQRYRWAFAIVFVTCLLGGIAAAAVMPTKYNHKATIEIGGMKEAQDDAALGEFLILESSASIQTRLKESIAPSVASRMRSDGKGAAFLDQLKVDVPKGAGMVIISVEATQEQQAHAFEFIDHVASALVESHNQVLDRRVELLRNHAEKRLVEVEEQLADLRATRRELLKSGNDDTTGFSSMLVSQQISQLLEQKSALTKQLAVNLEANVDPSQIIAGPARSAEPESPGILLIMAVAVLAGIFMGCAAVMLAVLREQAAIRSRESAVRVEPTSYKEASYLHRHAS